MINQTLLWLLALPICLAIAVFAYRRQERDAWKFSLAGGIAGVLIVSVVFFVSKGSKTGDIEIWNGQITSKSRDQGTYEESYECNCRTVYSGSGKDRTSSRQCDTCYRTHWTVKWNCNSTVGPFNIASADWTNPGVWLLPDPARYTSIQKGDPAAKRNTYVNYVQAVPNSLFTPSSADLKTRFAKLIPPYPDLIYDHYNVNRFLSPGWAPADAREWNREISLALRELGPKKQVNLIIVIPKTADSNYEYALQDAWEGVNKNDVVLVIGSTEYPKIEWVRVLSWTKSELFKIELRDTIMNKGTIDRSIIKIATDQIAKNFERRHMAEFAYLEGEIDPPEWLVWATIALLTLGFGALAVYMPRLTGGSMRRF